MALGSDLREQPLSLRHFLVHENLKGHQLKYVSKDHHSSRLSAREHHAAATKAHQRCRVVTSREDN